MKIPKVKYKVNIFCLDGSFIKGYIHVPEGLRILDFLNDLNENFVAVTEAQIQNVREIHSFKLVSELRQKKTTLFLAKASIKLIEEVEG
jgi:ribonucleotide monophosphatase NagD (HAD superfamily)